MKERQIIILFIISLLCGVSFSQNCKTAGCPSGQCCSQYGYCGTTADHCNTGRVCSPACAAGQCCSQYGYCGTTAEHCAGTGSATATSSTTKSATATSSSSGGRVCNPPCASGQCCSQYGYCGTTAEHCAGTGTAGSASSSSSGTATTGSGNCQLSNIFSQADFNTLFPNANAGANNPSLTPGVQKAIFTYNNIINAANYYPQFACTGDVNTRKRELAAFLAQTSQETSGHWGTQPYVWGYVYSTELGPSGLGCDANQCPYCTNSGTNPCAAGKGYFGRGPLQLSHNYNYGPVSRAIFNDNRLLTSPELIVNDGVLAFRTSLWFWMTTQSPKPSAHDVITGLWSPSSADTAAGRLPGFGMTTNIINGGLECTIPTPQKVTNRVKYFERYAGHFAISTGSNLYCNNMQHY